MDGERGPYEGGLGVVSAEVCEVSAKSPGLRYSPGLQNAVMVLRVLGTRGTKEKSQV